MAENEDEEKKEKKVEASLSAGVGTHAAYHTLIDEVVVRANNFRPIVDAHMHIQSLNATPMTLQWATLYKGSYKKMGGIITQKKMGKGRKYMSDTAAGWLARTVATKDFGNIGRFSTDLVAKIYMNNAKNGDMKASLYWLLWDDEKIKEFEEKKKDMLEEAGKKLELEALAIERHHDLQDFYKMTAYYYHRKHILHMSIVMPMDLSYGHFWGEHGMPIYLPKPNSNLFHYIDDFVQISVDRRISTVWTSKRVYIENIYRPANKPDDDIYHLSYDFDFKSQLENYIHYMGHRAGLKGYEEKPKEKPFLILFDHDTLQQAFNSMDEAIKKVEWERDSKLEYELGQTQSMEKRREINNKYESKIDKVKKEEGEKLKKLLDETKKRFKEEIADKKYKHFINDIKDDNTEIFEDYWLQRAYTEASAFRYPLRLVPFYHYEPRRYYRTEGQLKDFAKNINKLHGYYRLNNKEVELEDAEPDIKHRAELTIHELKGVEGDYYEEMFSDRYKDDTFSNEKELISHGSMEPNSIPLGKLYPDGCFMGVKVYPALGYPGDIYDRNYHKGDHYYSDQFKTVEELYEHCIEHNLPITSHCSPQGMSIADGFNYVIRDENKKGKAKRELYDSVETALHVDNICGDPDNWKRVLKKHNKLKLCLAHFGGMGVWNGDSQKKGWPDWRDKISDMIKDFPNVYTDISCYSMDFGYVPYSMPEYEFKLRVLVYLDNRDQELIKRYYKRDHPHDQDYRLKVYNKTERSTVRHLLRKAGYLKDDITTIGKELASYIQKNSKLKERILMGSDWYMAETSITGVGSYYARMFEMLKLITKELGDQYDVWYQFSVINPLNYLGLLKGKDGNLEKGDCNGKEIYLVDTDRVDKLQANLKKLGDNEEWRKISEIKLDEAKYFPMLSDRTISQLKRCTIYTAEEIKKDGNLIITYGQEV